MITSKFIRINVYTLEIDLKFVTNSQMKTIVYFKMLTIKISENDKYYVSYNANLSIVADVVFIIF